MMKTALRTIVAFVVLGAVAYGVTNYAGVIQQRFGFNTSSKAQQIVNNITTDINSGITAAEKQVLQMKISDVINGLSRFQKVPRDINGVKAYAQEQVTNVLQSVHKKK